MSTASLSNQRTVVATANRAELRRSPDAKAALAFSVDKDVVLQMVEPPKTAGSSCATPMAAVAMARFRRSGAVSSHEAVHFGAGAWGTALAVALAREHEVTLWARRRPDRGAGRQPAQHPLPARSRTAGQSGADRRLCRRRTSGELALVVTPIAGLRATRCAACTRCAARPCRPCCGRARALRPAAACCRTKWPRKNCRPMRCGALSPAPALPRKWPPACPRPLPWR